MVASREIHLTSRPHGVPRKDNFQTITVEVPEPGGPPVDEVDAAHGVDARLVDAAIERRHQRTVARQCDRELKMLSGKGRARLDERRQIVRLAHQSHVHKRRASGPPAARGRFR